MTLTYLQYERLGRKNTNIIGRKFMIRSGPNSK